MDNFKQQILSSLHESFDQCKFPPSEATLKAVQETIPQCIMGSQLISYLSCFGYIGKDYIELYGVNEKQGVQSDLVRQTLFLNENYPITKGYIAIENQGDGDYILCDSNDMVYEFIPENGLAVVPLQKTLLQYIVDRCK